MVLRYPQAATAGVQLTAPALAIRLDTNQLDISDVPSLVLTAEPRRIGSVLSNISGSVVYVGGRSVSAANGQWLPPGQSLSLECSCEVWAVCFAGDSAVISYLDEVY